MAVLARATNVRTLPTVSTGALSPIPSRPAFANSEGTTTRYDFGYYFQLKFHEKLIPITRIFFILFFFSQTFNGIKTLIHFKNTNNPLQKLDSCRPATPAPSTPRPIPTLPASVKRITTAVTKSASTILIIFVGITLFLFFSFRLD